MERDKVREIWIYFTHNVYKILPLCILKKISPPFLLLFLPFHLSVFFSKFPSLLPLLFPISFFSHFLSSFPPLSLISLLFSPSPFLFLTLSSLSPLPLSSHHTIFSFGKPQDSNFPSLIRSREKITFHPHTLLSCGKNKIINIISFFPTFLFPPPLFSPSTEVPVCSAACGGGKKWNCGKRCRKINSVKCLLSHMWVENCVL